ncbi:MAG: hypothetical protein PUI09_01185 [bacterium]|nr:hypothetical protein [bacterium]MDY2649513.1 hypothetical protein [Candidatus Egerieousia sp.]
MLINLTLISSSLHNITELSQKRMEVIEALKALGDVSIFKNSSPASCGIESATGQVVNVAYILTGGTESLFIKLFGENCSRLGNIAIISDAYHNSLAASQEICTWLYDNGVQHRHIHIPLHSPDATLNRLPTLLCAESPAPQRCECNAGVAATSTEAATAEAAGIKAASTEAATAEAATAKAASTEAASADALVKALGGCTIGLIGEASPWLIASGIDKEALSKRCGVSFREISIGTLADKYLGYRKLWKNHTLSAGARAELDEVLCRFSCSLEGDRTTEDLSDAAIMYLALASICKEEHLDAVTVKCFDLLSSCKTTACLALALLNDNGIIAGCEGDIPSICTMLAIYKALGRPSFMANPASIDSDNLSIDFAHCTIPTAMVENCTLPSHFESGIGIGINGEVPLGNYTMCKLSGKTLERSLICNGRLVKGEYLSNRCRTQVRFIFESKAEFDAFCKARVGNHIILFKRG